MPLAPAAKHCSAFSSVIPPIAITGKPRKSSVISFSLSNPCGGPYPRFDSVSNTGPNTTKSAPPSRATRAVTSECVEAPMRNSAPQISRTAGGGNEASVSCTPSAPATRATSNRSLTSKRVALPRTIADARVTSSKSTRTLSAFSRICNSDTSAATAASTNVRMRLNSSSSGVVLLFVAPLVIA